MKSNYIDALADILRQNHGDNPTMDVYGRGMRFHEPGPTLRACFHTGCRSLLTDSESGPPNLCNLHINFHSM